MKYNEGDVVCHKTNLNLKMMIIYSENNHLFGLRYQCRWFDVYNHICKDFFRESELTEFLS
jgi:uncharacterized protein YodC (DUF2158 family)